MLKNVDVTLFQIQFTASGLVLGKVKNYTWQDQQKLRQNEKRKNCRFYIANGGNKPVPNIYETGFEFVEFTWFLVIWPVRDLSKVQRKCSDNLLIELFQGSR